MSQEKTKTKFDYWHGKYVEECDNKRQWKKIAIKREGDNAGLRADLESMKAEAKRRGKEANNLKKKLEALRKSGEENARLAELFRFHLDDSANAQEFDNEWEHEARQMTRNEVDADYQGEGIDE